MSDDTLRDKIADAVFEASTFESDGNGGIIHDCRDEDATDRIIELVREALLAPEAVESTGRKIWEHGGYCNSYESIADSMNRSVRATITAALDAALGGDGHE